MTEAFASKALALYNFQLQTESELFVRADEQ